MVDPHSCFTEEKVSRARRTIFQGEFQKENKTSLILSVETWKA